MSTTGAWRPMGFRDSRQRAHHSAVDYAAAVDETSLYLMLVRRGSHAQARADQRSVARRCAHAAITCGSRSIRPAARARLYLLATQAPWAAERPATDDFDLWRAPRSNRAPHPGLLATDAYGLSARDPTAARDGGPQLGFEVVDVRTRARSCRFESAHSIRPRTSQPASCRALDRHWHSHSSRCCPLPRAQSSPRRAAGFSPKRARWVPAPPIRTDQ